MSGVGQSGNQTGNKRLVRDYEIVELSRERGYARLVITVRERKVGKDYSYLYLKIPREVAESLGVKQGMAITVEIQVRGE